MPNSLRLVFFGSGPFALTALKGLVGANHHIMAVCTREARRAGRGQRRQHSEVAAYSEKQNINVLRCDHPNDSGLLMELAQLDLDVGILADYAHLLPDNILSLPAKGFLNIHPSLLPRWRGAAPIQRAIMAGDDITGISIMQMTSKLDSGPVLMRQEIPIRPSETFGSLMTKLAAQGSQMMLECLRQIDQLKPIKLPDTGSSYAKKIAKNEARIDWTKDANQVDYLVRGLSPSPGAWSHIRGTRIKILATQLEDGKGVSGTFLDDNLLVACKTHAVRILQLQRSGKSAMTAADFLRGFPIKAGEIFDQE